VRNINPAQSDKLLRSYSRTSWFDKLTDQSARKTEHYSS